ncbi:helix-turn-helix domain-containing protein [Actinacidiphila acidipaludis]|uniref:helix-turn-helix domain-containing protein n=1 Tax=Actinacidiphila acidipaludis TaxID=2873382 RepID=UPI00223C4453|nr:helix-turn-helix transcriptional regulator [Streptomyces acidipaludis]
MRRLATQLRRMKDRGGLTVPALAARTAQSVESWERALAGRQLPPLDAVEVLAQASGADYDRVGALWKLAERASTGSGDRGRGKPLPNPDPLDPLGADEGLPRRGRRLLLLATVGVLAAAALVAVLLTAGPSTGRVPPGSAGPTVTGVGVPEGGTPRARGTGTPNPGGGPGRATTTVGPSGSGTPAGDRPSPATESLSPAPGTPTAPGTGGASGNVPAPPGAGTPGGGPTTAQPPSTGVPSAPPSSSPSPSPSPAHSRLCLGLIVLGVCIG